MRKVLVFLLFCFGFTLGPTFIGVREDGYAWVVHVERDEDRDAMDYLVELHDGRREWLRSARLREYPLDKPIPVYRLHRWWSEPSPWGVW